MQIIKIPSLQPSVQFSAKGPKKRKSPFLNIKCQEIADLAKQTEALFRPITGGTVTVRHSQTTKAHYWTVNKLTHAGFPEQIERGAIVLAFQLARFKKTGKLGVVQVMTKEGDETGFYSRRMLNRNPKLKVPDVADQIDYWTHIFLDAKYKITG